MAKLHLITGLDIGTNSIKVLVAARKTGEDESELEIIAQNQETAFGIRKGVVVDVREVAKAISICLEKIQKDIGQKINGVYVNIGGSHLFCVSSRGLISVSRADQKISREDIERVIQGAQIFPFPANKEILETFPTQYIVDGQRDIKEPLGMGGTRLEAEVLVVGGFSPYLKNLNQAVSSAGFRINDLVITPIASAKAALTPREKELGVALLDIGAGNSSLAVFEEGDLIHLVVLPIGSNNITNDIAIGMKIDIDIAERIKLEIGSCLSSGVSKSKLKKIQEEFKEELSVFPSKILFKIINARVGEIFDQVDKELKKISRQKLLPAGIIITGGGAHLPQLVEMAKRELKLPARIGLPRGFSPSLEDPSMATVAGLVLHGLETEGGLESSDGFGEGFFSDIKKILKTFKP